VFLSEYYVSLLKLFKHSYFSKEILMYNIDVNKLLKKRDLLQLSPIYWNVVAHLHFCLS